MGDVGIEKCDDRETDVSSCNDTATASVDTKRCVGSVRSV